MTKVLPFKLRVFTVTFYCRTVCCRGFHSCCHGLSQSLRALSLTGCAAKTSCPQQTSESWLMV